MATTILTVGTLPQAFTSGNWPYSTMNTASFHFQWTPAAASSSGSYSVGAVAFWALLASNDSGGLWVVNNGSNVLSISAFNQGTGATIFDQAVTWAAGATVDITVKNATGELVLSGFATGNGTFSFTPASIFSNATLGVGQYGGGGFTLPSSTFSNVDDAATGITLAADPGSYALTGTAAGLKVTHRLVADAGSYAVTGTDANLTKQTSLSLLGVFSASLIPALWWDRTLSPYAWFAIEAATTPAAPGSYTLTADPGSYALTGTAAGLTASRILGAGAGSYTLTGVNATISRVLALGAGAGSYALTGTDVGFRRALRLVAGSGSYALTGTDATLSVPGSLDLGDHAIDFQTYGSASRDAAITLDTQASGSIVIIAAGGLLGDVSSAFTDNKSNTIQKIGSATAYVDWGTDYGVSMARTKPPMTGGTSHTFTVPVTLFSESTAFAIEVIGGGRIVGYSWINTSNTGAGATVTSDPVTAYEPVVWISFWWGAHPVFSPDTTPFQASAAGSGFTDLDSYLINNSSGEVQAASAALVDNTPSVSSPVTKTVTWSHYPNQGAQVILIAVAAPARLTASDGSYAIAGSDVTLRRTYNLIAEAGSCALTGSSVALRLAKTISAEAGAYAVTGADVGLHVTRRLSCEAGSYATTGTDAALRLTRAVVAAPGSYATTGTDARLLVAHRLTADAGSYATTGTAANLARALRLVADAGAYALTGTAAALRASRVLVAAAGAYAWTGADVGLGYLRRLVAEVGAYALTGTDVDFSIVDTGPPVRLPALLTITARGESAFTIAAFAGEAPFTVAPAVVAPFTITGPADMFTIGADPGPFVVTGTEPTFTVTATADAPFTVEEV